MSLCRSRSGSAMWCVGGSPACRLVSPSTPSWKFCLSTTSVGSSPFAYSPTTTAGSRDSSPAFPTTSVIDIKRLRQDPDGTRANLLRRGDGTIGELLDEIVELDRRRRDLLTRVEALKAERNAASDEVARRKRSGEAADDLMHRLKASGEEGRSLDLELREIETVLDARA